MPKIFQTVVKKVIVNNGNIPDGAVVISDKLGPVKLIYSENNISQTDQSSFSLNVKYTESNVTQSENIQLKINGLLDSNEVPSEQGSSMTVVYTATGTWTAPTGVTSVIVECLGGGQGGAAGNATAGGTGGAGGSYARSTLTVVPGTAYTVTVGAAAAAGAVGNSSWFQTATTIRGKGGGNADTTIGTTTFAGGTGAAGALLGVGGGGGGAAGAAANGNNGTNGTAGTAGASTGKTYYIKGGGGGAGATGAGVVGTAPGGGGGGGGGSLTNPGAASAGTRGEVRITWTIA